MGVQAKTTFWMSSGLLSLVNQVHTLRVTGLCSANDNGLPSEQKQLTLSYICNLPYGPAGCLGFEISLCDRVWIGYSNTKNRQEIMAMAIQCCSTRSLCTLEVLLRMILVCAVQCKPFKGVPPWYAFSWYAFSSLHWPYLGYCSHVDRSGRQLQRSE